MAGWTETAPSPSSKRYTQELEGWLLLCFAEWGTPTEGRGELLATTGSVLRRYEGEKETAGK